MGCQCNNQKEEQNTEISKNDDNLDDYNNNEQKDEIFGLSNQDGLDPENLIEANNENENDNQINHQNEDKNAKYADYPKKMLELINKIRANPSSYADVVLDGINNIIISFFIKFSYSFCLYYTFYNKWGIFIF